MSVFRIMLGIVVIAWPAVSPAQTLSQRDSSSLRGRHEIEVGIGLLSALTASSEVDVGGAMLTSEASGIAGSIGYTYWYADEWGFNLSLGVSSADASMSVSGSGVSFESAAVIPVLLGVRFRPPALAMGDALRPYGFAAIGPYFGSASNVRAEGGAGIESYTETALGSRFGAGLDLSLGKRFTLGFEGGYRLVSDFGRRIGSKENHSSPEFALSFGVVVGDGTN